MPFRFAPTTSAASTRRRHLSRLISVVSACVLAPIASAQTDQDYKEKLTATEVQALVRYSNALQNTDLFGKLINSKGQKEPFRLTMQDRFIRFAFDKPAQIIQLDIKDSSYLLREAIGGQEKLIPFTRFAEPIRNSEIWYEDLAMRYLYWPKPTLEGEQKIKTRLCWKLRVYNPTNLGPYHCVEIWVDKGSGGLMKMQGYDYDGKMIKRSTVLGGHKLEDGTWVLKEMRIESFKPGASSPYAKSYLEIDKPKKK